MLTTPEKPVRRLEWSAGADRDVADLVEREWLVTNGLGGYSSGTIAGVVTRRYHGLLVAALPNPLGRTVMLNQLHERVVLPDGSRAQLGGEERTGRRLAVHGAAHLRDFRLDMGLPVWRYAVDGRVIEKRVVMPYRQNSVHVQYTLLEGEGTLRVELQPALHFRGYEDSVDLPLQDGYRLGTEDGHYVVTIPGSPLPPLRLFVHGGSCSLVVEEARLGELQYRVEEDRGYAFEGALWTPGWLTSELSREQPVTLVASAEPLETARAIPPGEATALEHERRERLLQLTPAAAGDPVVAELVLAADQFVISPAGRVADRIRAQAVGDDVRTVIAGYHWFTDWGRDTMISLEGLTLVTGRYREAAAILREFARHVRHGLLPNMFPDGSNEGLYHTADATLWFFHALQRFLRHTGDLHLVAALLPTMESIVEHHTRGTHYGIRVDPADGLLTQGEEGYQLTWMDAKVDGWVVTPRRGKAVEINALWHNALCLTADWVRQIRGESDARGYAEAAARARESFNRRFWFAEGGYLYDIVDGPEGDSTECRPNQVFAIALDHPVLDRERWEPVMRVVEERLLTPVGLRSLAPGSAEYRKQYWGDLRTRDAAYHQGTVWGWLIGPFVDAWLEVHPGDRASARRFLQGFVQHLDDFGVGSIAEIFDAEAPFTARGCVAQAWSVAEVLRCWLATAPEPK
jgi:predicted glycogen debranching enzyme